MGYKAARRQADFGPWLSMEDLMTSSEAPPQETAK
jgi:hypothetical protein